MKKFNKKILYAKEDKITESIEDMAFFLNNHGMRYDRMEDVIYRSVENILDNVEIKIDKERELKNHKVEKKELK